jgi:hypothetical protein
MIPFFVFLTTAVCIGWLTRFWGGSSGEHEVGYTAAVLVLFAAYLSAFTLWAGRCLAALGLVVAVIYCLCEDIGPQPRVLTPWTFLALLVLVGALAYVVGTFSVRGPQTIFFPRHASKPGKVLVWIFMIGPAFYLVWTALWGNVPQIETKTVPAHWESVTLDQVTSGRHQVKFTAQAPQLTVTVASDELYNELQAAQKGAVNVVIKETFKHGEMIAWSVESIDGHTDEDFSVVKQALQEQ